MRVLLDIVGQEAGEGVVGAVAGLVDVELGVEGHADKTYIADEVEQLVRS